MEINKYLADNLAYLAETGDPVGRWLAEENPDPAIVHERLHRNASGIVDWRMDDGVGLFEKLPPPFFYRDWRPKEQLEGAGTIIVGVGIGYGLNHVLTGTPDSHKVLVAEPRPEMLLACLGQTDYRPYLRHGKLRFVPPRAADIELAIQNFDVSFLFSRVWLRNDLACQQMGPEYPRLGALVKAKMESLSVELTTLRHKQEVMVGNELRNYSRAMDEGSLARMAGMAKGLTAVLLGAGPSLAEFAPVLREHRDKGFYAAALQTLPALERLGIKPDLCLAIDFNDNMMQSLDNLRDLSFAADIPFVYSTKMDPAVVARYPGPRIPLWTQGGIGTYVLKDQELVLDAGGNVSVTLERLLGWAGAERFVFVGCDLSWQGERTHVDGHHNAVWVHKYNPRDDVKLNNLHGQTIYTHMGFLAAKRDIEKDINASSAGFFNLYGGGVVIEGAVNVGAADLASGELFASRGAAKDVFLEALARAANPRTRPIFAPKADSWATSLKNASRRLEKLMRKADKHQREIKDLLSQIQFFTRHDPLYMPYLYNEIMDLAGLVQTKKRYGVKELTAFKAIRGRILEKTKQIDACLAPSGSWAA